MALVLHCTGVVKFYELRKPFNKVRTMPIIELRNGRFLDVLRGQLYNPKVRVVLQGGRILSMPGLPDQPEPRIDYAIDLGGMTVSPGLFNTHCHVVLPTPGTVLTLREARFTKKHARAQVTRNLKMCL